MAIVQPVKDGKIVETQSEASLKKANESGMDKDAFLQLLVAQMRYQDPLEPTSNTEFVAQYAQFSQVEQMQNMASSMDLMRASGLVGQEVYVKTTTSTGADSFVKGQVDYVSYENGKAYLSINESLYSIEDLDSVVDKTYQAAYDKAQDFAIRMNKLPGVNGVDMSVVDEIDKLNEIYTNMNDYEKTFIASDYVTSLEKYVEKAKQVRLAAEQQEGNENGSGEDLPEEDSEGGEDTPDVEG